MIEITESRKLLEQCDNIVKKQEEEFNLLIYPNNQSESPENLSSQEIQNDNSNEKDTKGTETSD